MSALLWATSFASLVGMWLNLRKRASCFWVWAVTNAIWACVDVTLGLHAQAALQAVYFALSIFGIWKWGWRRDTR